MRSDEMPRTFIEQARRRQILDAAVEVLADQGYAAASLAAIAGRAGVSKGVISYHFAGKEELLREVVASVLEKAGSFMTPRVAAAAENGGAAGALRAYVRANLLFLAEHRRQVRALAEVLGALPPGPDGAPAYEGAGAQAVAALAQLLAAGQASGEFAAFSVPVAARSLRAAIDAVTELLRTDPDVDLDAYATDLLLLVERALLTDRGRLVQPVAGS